MTVYFAQCETSPGVGPIKIGHTSTPIKQRMASMRTHCPFPIKLLCAFDGAEDTENLLHDRFSKYRMHREWYRDEPELMEFVESVVKAGGLPPEIEQTREWMAATAAAKLMGISYDACLKLCRTGQIKAEKVNRRWRVHVSCLERK